jgi:hypothetical protein
MKILLLLLLLLLSLQIFSYSTTGNISIFTYMRTDFRWIVCCSQCRLETCTNTNVAHWATNHFVTEKYLRRPIDLLYIMLHDQSHPL